MNSEDELLSLLWRIAVALENLVELARQEAGEQEEPWEVEDGND